MEFPPNLSLTEKPTPEQLAEESNGVYDVDGKDTTHHLYGKKCPELSERNRRTDDWKGEKNPWYGKDRSGDKNPMYDNNHTEESKKKISEGKKGVTPDQSYLTDEIRKIRSDRMKAYNKARRGEKRGPRKKDG